ncbi:unnamed protein product [Symbiodinium necroappetens]|uniref:Uncharacterized protein n=1 Tax=Symbiodinium necroappetens TaxID=1628268 RepID=A0A812LWF2_9DINO|nr:unnamed protein product [Symbiodinium necroappetens]
MLHSDKDLRDVFSLSCQVCLPPGLAREATSFIGGLEYQCTLANFVAKDDLLLLHKVPLSSESSDSTSSERDSRSHSPCSGDGKKHAAGAGGKAGKAVEKSPKSMDVDFEAKEDSPRREADSPVAESLHSITLVEAPSRGVKCPICNAWVKLRANLARHQRESARCRKYQGLPVEQCVCRCGKSFPGEWSLEQHLQSGACTADGAGGAHAEASWPHMSKSHRRESFKESVAAARSRSPLLRRRRGSSVAASSAAASVSGDRPDPAQPLNPVSAASGPAGRLMTCTFNNCKDMLLLQSFASLTAEETKQQLLTGCFSQGDAHAFYNQIAAVSHTVHEKRWNTIATAIELAADLEVALRAGWDLDDFMRGRKPPSSRQEDTSPAVAFGVNLQQVDEAIHSDFFWASIKVFLEVARVQRQAVRFVTSCPCHYGLSRTGVDQAVLDKWDSCPMRGRRCPEICGGDFFAMMQETMQAGSVSLEMQLPRSLSQEEKLKLLRDFELSRQMLLTTYVVKLSFWSQAPFAVVGIAHHDPAIRMKSCVTCLQLKSDHPKIQLLQKHEDVVRAFLVAGCLWDETGAFNVLKELAAEVRLFFSTAWRVEGQHAKTRRAVDHAPCRSAAFVSFLHRKLEFAAHLRAHPEAAVEVAELMGRALNGVAAAKALGFSVAAMEKSAWFNWGKQKSSFRYIYHDDPYLKYVLPLPPSWKRVLPERLLSQPDMVLPQGSCLLRWTLAQQHIKQHANRGCYMSVKYNPHLLYSVRSILAPDEDGAILRVQDGNLLGDDFDEVGQAGRLNALPCPQHQLVSLKAFLEGAGDVAEEVMFFSLMHKSPQRYHRTKTVSEVSLKDSWFVQLHDILAMRPEKKEVLVSLQGVALGPTATDKWEDAPLALHVAHLDLASLKAMWLWEVDASAAVHRFDNQMMSTIPQQMHERLETLLQQLVGSNSLCGRPEEDPAIAELLDILVSESLVEGPPWKLTPTGAERTRQAVRLWNEVPLLRRTEKPLSEASLYQLVLELDAAGFTHEVVTASKHKKLKKQQSPHLQEGQKMWFTRSDDVTVCRSYVLALLSCPVEQVPYAAAEKEYLRLLGLEQTPALGNKKGKRKRLHVNDDWPDDALSQPRARVPRTRRSAAASSREQQRDPIDDALSQLGGDSDVPADEDDNVEEGVSANGGPGAAAVAKAAAAPALKRQGRGYLWGDHLLTPVGDDDANPKHWQIRCGDPLHNLAGWAFGMWVQGLVGGRVAGLVPGRPGKGGLVRACSVGSPTKAMKSSADFADDAFSFDAMNLNHGHIGSNPPRSPRTSPHKRRYKQGSLADHLSTLHCQAGPGNLFELFDFPKEHVRTMSKHPELLARACQLLEHGIVHSSDYAGMLAEREGMRLLLQALHEEASCSGSYTFTRACDIDRDCQQLLLHSAQTQDQGQSCIFLDICQQIHPTAQAWCQACLPKAEDSSESCAAAYDSMDEFLRANGSWAVDQEHSCECLVHGKPCIVSPPRPLDKSLVINTAGNTCVGWSSVGKRSKHAHKSQHAFFVWLAQRRELARRGQEDLFFQECTPDFDAASCIAQRLSETHFVTHAVIGPRGLGWPTARDRRLSCGLSLQTLVWTGPESPQEVQQDFERFFQRRCSPNVTGSIFFQASDAVVRAWVQRKMQRRTRVADQESVPVCGKDMFMLVLTPAQLQRLEHYGKLSEGSSSLGGTMIADLDHWPNAAASHGPTWPCMLKHGTIVDVGASRIAMTVDRCLALGFHVKECGNSSYRWPLEEYMQGVRDRVGQALTGNSQSLPAILAWYLYVFCHTCRREQCTVQPSLRYQTDESDDKHD